MVRKVLEQFNPVPFYLVTLLEEQPEVSSTRWREPPNPQRQHQGFRALDGERLGVWEVKVGQFRRPTGLLAGDGQIVDELWHIVPNEWLELEAGREIFGTDEEALRVCIEHLRLFDAKRRMNVNALIP